MLFILSNSSKKFVEIAIEKKKIIGDNSTNRQDSNRSNWEIFLEYFFFIYLNIWLFISSICFHEHLMLIPLRLVLPKK